MEIMKRKERNLFRCILRSLRDGFCKMTPLVSPITEIVNLSMYQQGVLLLDAFIAVCRATTLHSIPHCCPPRFDQAPETSPSWQAAWRLPNPPRICGARLRSFIANNERFVVFFCLLLYLCFYQEIGRPNWDAMGKLHHSYELGTQASQKGKKRRNRKRKDRREIKP